MRSKRFIATVLAATTIMGITLSGCGNKVNESATFATLGDTTITMGVANFCAKYEQATLEPFYLSYFGENMWNSDLYGNGNTLSVDVKNEVATNLQAMYLSKEHMQEFGLSVSEAEEAKIAKAAEDFIAANSKAAVKQIGATNIENVKEVLRLRTIQKKVYDRVVQDAVVEVTDEEAAQRTFSYMMIDTSGYNGPDSTFVQYSEEEKAGLKQTAATVAAAEDFDEAVASAGYTVNTASYGSAADENPTMDVVVLEEADKLSPGQVSGVIETANAYYVIRLDSEHDAAASEAKKEELIQQKKNDYYNEVLEGWKAEKTWTINEEEWAKVEFKDHFSAPEAEEEAVVEDTTEAE